MKNDQENCTCLEVFGEDPTCPLHGGPLRLAVYETFGGRCDVFDPECETCQAWAEIDRVATRSSPAPEVSDSPTCQDCNGHNPVWFAPNELWNRVMGGENATDDPGGIVCVQCFIRRAEAAGIIPTAWVLSPEVLPTPDAAMEEREQELPRKFKLRERVTKLKGSSWTGRVVGFYSTSLTPIGYAVESENEPGSVQIYPEAALVGCMSAEELEAGISECAHGWAEQAKSAGRRTSLQRHDPSRTGAP